jgi:outer membrane immunogenic protein
MVFATRFLAAASVSLIAVTAQAADLPSSKMAPVAPMFLAYNWTGFYVGIQGGYQWGRDRTVEFVTATGAATGFNTGFRPNGFVGGLHVGYNHQINQFVVGLEGDVELSGYDGGYRLGNGNGTRFKSDWQGSLRGRVGVAFDRLLVYVTGGVAFAELKHTYFTNAGVTEGFSKTKAGWTLGAGLEYAFTANLTGRVEYRYADYGRISHSSVVAFPGFTYRHDPQVHAVRAGLSYKF